ncbi:MAG: FAD-dependent oxidoreductase, partial [Clostridiales Family XIII bacterium]|nr:FAD-dependent oxidoreductase [Clostridiales Family XIII bacterium]
LFQTVDGRPNDYYIGYLEHKARGGAAIVTLGEANVYDGGNHTPMMEMTHDNRSLYGEMAAAIHEHGAVASVELTHGGVLAKPQFNRDRDLIFGPTKDLNPMNQGCCREMTEGDMERIAHAYADATEYYLSVGFDTVLVHAGHGWLLQQFLSPLKNKRTDRYGGSPENRMRFPLEVFRTIRARVGEEPALMARISGSERHPDGFSPQDMADFLAQAQAYIDLVEVSTEGFEYTFAGPYMPHGQNVAFAEEIKSSGKVNIPVFTVGSISSPAFAEEVIASGRADGVSVSRALIADPYFPKKAALGRAGDIVPCLRCSNCTGSDNANRHFVCSVNPLLARESRLGFGADIGKAPHKRRVLVVGGGPAGITAAVTAAGRGHAVQLVEQADAAGGWLRFSDTDSLKHDVRLYKDYLLRQLDASGVELLLGTEVTPALAQSLAPDHIIVATGSAPIVPASLPGIGRAMHASQVYFAPSCAQGDDFVIIGGGLIGVEAGLHLQNIGKNVTVLEMQGEYATDALPLYKAGLAVKIGELGLDIRTSVRVLGITEAGVHYESGGAEAEAQLKAGAGAAAAAAAETVIPADTVLYAVGMRAQDELYFALTGCAPFISLAGDARKVGKIDGAVHGGFFAALDVGDV